MFINQYDYILAITAWMRKNPNDPRCAQIKQCKSQSEQFEVFKTIIG